MWLNRTRDPRISVAKSLGALGLGFLLVLTPWLVRNYFAFGSAFAPGGTRTLVSLEL